MKRQQRGATSQPRALAQTLGMQVKLGAVMHDKNGKPIRALQNLSFALAATYSVAAFAYDPLDCLNEIARIDPEINMGLATKLCSGTWTPEPVKCYQLVSEVDDGIIRGIAIDLCAGSVNAEKTVACYAKAGTERKMNRGLATTLCGAKKDED